ncbi:MAG TPA: hypothetical protein VFT98_23230 [Myxococcota bacterium]|nr:hypothetical protein [Myxococcota bacterium]
MDVVGDQARSGAGGCMKAERFFTLVWRANGLILLVVGAAGLLALAAGLAFWAIGKLTRDEPPPPTEVAGRDVTRWNSRLGWVHRVEGTFVLRVALTTEEEIEQTRTRATLSSGGTYFYESYGGSTQNYFYVDLSTGTARWLLPGNDQLIPGTIDLPGRGFSSGGEYFVVDGADPRGAPPPIVTVFQIIERDTNEDGRLGSGDESSIALAKPDGSRFTRLLDRVDELHASELNGGALSILYTRERVLRLARIELPAFRIASDIELKAVQPQ